MVPVRKLRLYLDTSILGCLDQPDSPERMADTLELWEILQRQEKYEAVISRLTFNELGKCKSEKRAVLAKYMKSIDYTFVPITRQHVELTQKYLQHKVLSEKSKLDLLHIACSVLTDCEYAVSWNFRHFVNIATINKVNSVNLLFGLREVRIVSPSMLLE
jgi:uncharacterized FlgJ-related protein